MHVYCTVWCYLILGGAETWNLGHLQNLLPGSYQVLAGCPAFKGRSRCQDGRRWFVPAFRPAQLATNKMSLIYGSTHILPGIQTTVFGEILIFLSMINQMYKNMHGINEYIYIYNFFLTCILHHTLQTTKGKWSHCTICSPYMLSIMSFPRSYLQRQKSKEQ